MQYNHVLSLVKTAMFKAKLKAITYSNNKGYATKPSMTAELTEKAEVKVNDIYMCYLQNEWQTKQRGWNWPFNYLGAGNAHHRFLVSWPKTSWFAHYFHIHCYHPIQLYAFPLPSLSRHRDINDHHVPLKHVAPVSIPQLFRWSENDISSKGIGYWSVTDEMIRVLLNTSTMQKYNNVGPWCNKIDITTLIRSPAY